MKIRTTMWAIMCMTALSAQENKVSYEKVGLCTAHIAFNKARSNTSTKMGSPKSALKTKAMDKSSFQKIELSTLYRIQLFKVSNGQKDDFIETQQKLEAAGFFETWSVGAPFLSEKLIGDMWDLITIHPMISYEKYFDKKSLENRRKAHGEFGNYVEDLIHITDNEEDLFSVGPGVETLKTLFAENSHFTMTAIHAKAKSVERILQIVDQWNAIRTALKFSTVVPFFVEGGSDIDILLLTFYPNLEATLLEYKTSLEPVKNEAAISAGLSFYDEIQNNLAKASIKMTSTITRIIQAEVEK